MSIDIVEPLRHSHPGKKGSYKDKYAFFLEDHLRERVLVWFFSFRSKDKNPQKGYSGNTMRLPDLIYDRKTQLWREPFGRGEAWIKWPLKKERESG